jgi:ribosomal protein S18 acetylase RimI-like enzyme
MPIRLRPIEASDEGFLFDVYASTRADEMAQVDWNTAQKETFLRMQFESQHNYYTENYPGAKFQVILYEGQPAGRLYLHHRIGEIRIMEIALLPEFRSRGIGTTLIRKILTDARSLSLPVTIHVERFNPALALYQRLGFHLKEDKGVYLLLECIPNSAE